MLPILRRIRVIAGRDRVLAANLVIAAHRRQLAASLIAQHLPRGRVGGGLRVVKTRCLVGVISLVRPFAIGSLVHGSVTVFSHHRNSKKQPSWAPQPCEMPTAYCRTLWTSLPHVEAPIILWDSTGAGSTTGWAFASQRSCAKTRGRTVLEAAVAWRRP